MSGFDVKIFGAGPAGAVTALELARRGRRVLLLERGGPPSDFKAGETLPPAANRLLAELGLGDRLGPELAFVCPGNQSAWGGDELIDQDFLHSPDGLGLHVDRLAFERLLQDRAKEAGASLRADPECEEPARFEVDATGKARVLLRRLGVKARADDRLIAHAATLAPGAGGEDLDQRTLVEAEPDGWWYTACVPQGRRVVMFFTDADLPAARETDDWAGFLRRLARTRHAGSRLTDGRYEPVGPILTRSAAGSEAARVVGKGWLAVGDAAASYDPLSSQGMLSAMTAARYAAAAIDAMLAGEPPSGPAAAAYLEHIRRSRSEYLERHREYYRAEGRFARRPFWRRRLAAGG